MHNPAKYFATPAVNMVYAYEEGLKTVLVKGWGIVIADIGLLRELCGQL